ncbi:MAG: acetoacetate decarboxylase family protein [Deltaproteobacteria bacterium]|nr:acetoacetate decarboxylase family protein [Deltaproteobacteria bacterium]
MGFTKTAEELAGYFELRAREFPGAEMLGVVFETRPEIVERLLPPPLEPTGANNGLMFIAQYPETNLGPGYREAALFLGCRYRGETGNYCLSMPIESEDSRLHNGRDIFGFPKKMAKIHLQVEGDRISGWVERHGIRFVEIEASLMAELPELPAPGPNFLFKAMPRIDLSPGFDGPVLLCRQHTDIAMKRLRVGSAEVTLRESGYDPWAEVEIANVIVAYHLVSDNTMQPGSVLGEVDAEAFLPFYFKMTDFFSKGDAR